MSKSKKNPCGLDYCPMEELIGAYASCYACAWNSECDDEMEGAEAIVTEPTTQMKTQNSHLTFEKEDEHCKGCKHYKLTCDLFSEICKFEPKNEPQTERHLPDYSYEADLGRRIMEQTMRDENYIYAYDKTHGEWYPIQEIDRPCNNCQEWDCYGCDYKK